MKKLGLMSFMLLLLISVKAQISVISDSVVTLKSEVVPEKFTPVAREAEKLSLEIDKDLMTLRVFGTGHEHAIMEKAYIIDLLSVDSKKEKWLFQGTDKNCIGYTITIDIPRKKVEFITLGREPVSGKSLTEIYYPITDIKINNDAIDRHLKEKGASKL